MSNIGPYYDYREFFTKMITLLPPMSKAEIGYWMSELGEVGRRLEAALKPESLGRRMYLRRYACLDIPLTIIGPQALATMFECDSELFWNRLPEVPWSTKVLKDWHRGMKKRFGNRYPTGPVPVLFLKDFPDGVCTSLACQLEWPISVVGNKHVDRPAERLIPELYTRGLRNLDHQQALLTAADLLCNPIPSSGPQWEMMYLEPPMRPAHGELYRSHQECVDACAAEGLELASVEETLAMLQLIIGPMSFRDSTSAVVCGRLRYWTATSFGERHHLAVEAYMFQNNIWLKLVPINDDSTCMNLMAKGFRPV